MKISLMKNLLIYHSCANVIALIIIVLVVSKQSFERLTVSIKNDIYLEMEQK